MSIRLAGLVFFTLLAGPAALNAQETAAEPAPLVDSTLTIFNQSGSMIMRFEVAPILPEPEAPDTSAAAADGGEQDPNAAEAAEPVPAGPGPSGDLMRGGVISDGSNGIIMIPGGASLCRFKLTFGLRDGRVIETEADVCLNPVFTLS